MSENRVALVTNAREYAGPVALSQLLAKELGPFNIQVNSNCPNWLKSETWFSDKRLAESPKFAERIKK